MSDDELVGVMITGLFRQGAPIGTSAQERAYIPEEVYDRVEDVYRVEEGIAALKLRRFDFLLISPRPDGNASTGEVVLAEFDGRAYLGRWWTKHGRRALLDEEMHTLCEGNGLRVLGVLTMSLRTMTQGGLE